MIAPAQAASYPTAGGAEKGRGNGGDWTIPVASSTRGPTIAGLIILLFCIAGFGVWSALAPLDGAVVASGTFVATGQNKQVQHLEGGIIRQVLVKEGDLVEAQAPVVRLEDTAAKAKLRRLSLRRARLVAVKVRVGAEIVNAELPNYAELAARGDLPKAVLGEDLAEALAQQRLELGARRSRLDAETQVFRKEIAALQSSIASYQEQAATIRQRLSLFSEELSDKSELLGRQLIRKSEIFNIQRAEAGLAGELAELTGRAADASERVARAEQQIAQLQTAATQSLIEALRITEAELDDVAEQIRAAEDVAGRVEVRAPVRGIVVKLHHHTIGGVVAPGAVLLELLPVQDDLVIEARLEPSKISNVADGQEALVRLSALSQRVTPMVKARVVYLSADALRTDAATFGRSGTATAFVVRVRLDDEDLRRNLPGFKPTPGLPADIYIKTGQRTFFQYLMQPVEDSLSRAFREY